MKTIEALPRIQEARFAANLASRVEDHAGIRIKGEVFVEMFEGGRCLEHRKLQNIVTLDASILLARLLRSNVEPSFGAFCLAVGTGDVGWNPLSPPAATNTQRSLYSEITRKTFAATQFVDGTGMPVAYPTNVVDFTTTFTESEAVGPLCEMGIIGGNVSSNLSVRNPVLPPNGPRDITVDLTTKETLVNYLTFACISKPATSTLTITWRLTL